MLSLMLAQAAGAGLLLEEARAMPPARLAAALLARPGQVERAVVHPTDAEPPSNRINWVDLYSSVIAAPERGFCERQYTFVNMVPAEEQGSYSREPTRMRAFEPRVETQLRYASTRPCDGLDDGFFQVTADGRASQVAAINALLTARAQAARRAPLPIALSCTDDTRLADEAGGCGTDRGRRLLSGLPVETPTRVTPNVADPSSATVGFVTDRAVIEAQVTTVAGRAATVALTRKAKPPSFFGYRRRP